MEKSRLRSMKWWQFHHALWRYKFIVGTMLVVGTFLMAVYTSRIPKQYRATASDMVDSFYSASAQDYSGSSVTDLSRAHKALAESTKVRKKAADMSALPPSAYTEASFDARVDGVLIYFSVTDGDYENARKLANAWSEAFRAEIEDRVRFGGEREQIALSKELEVYQKQLKEAEAKKAEFFEKTHFSPEHFAKDPIHGIVSAYEQKMRTADDLATGLKKELEVVSNPENDPAIFVTLPHVTGSTIFLGRLQKAKENEVALAEAKIKFNDGPEIREAEARVSQAKVLLEKARQELVGQLKLLLDVTASERDAANSNYVKNKKELDEKLQLMAQYSAITANIESIKHAYDYVNDHKRENSLAQRTTHNAVIEWEKAPEIDSPVPVRPNWRQNMTMGVILSFLLACALVFALEQIDDTVRTPRDLEQRMGATVLGSVPSCGRNLERQGYFMAKRQSTSIAVDSLRGIHIGLEVNRRPSPQSGALIVTVTSAVPQDGKSFVASNLGTLFASLGRKVLVVDADLRKASLTKALEAKERDGFFEVLKTLKWSRDYAINGKTPGYYLLAAGQIHDSASESLHPESVNRLLEHMRKDYDVIIFDTPPVLALPDACVLGQLSDVTVLVTRSRQTRMAQIERAASTLQAAKVRELVFVVNGVDASDAAAETYSGGYGYGSGYGYAKGYGYGAEDKKNVTAKTRASEAADDDEEDE